MQAENFKIEWTGPYLSDYFRGAGTSFWNPKQEQEGGPL